MDRWEYLTMDFGKSYGVTTYHVNGEKIHELKNQPLHEVLNQLGKEGWEIVGISGETGNYYTFKRPLRVKPKATGALETNAEEVQIG